MVKKRGITTIILVVLILSSLNAYLFLNKEEISYASISGQFIKEMPELPLGLNFSLLAFIIQGLILFLIIIITFMHYLKRKRDEKINLSHSKLVQKTSKSETSLDVLYNLLKDKKRLNIKTIAKLFGITKEKAIEWAKILENYELVTIEYPTFNDPEVRINEKEDETNENKKQEKAKDGEKEKKDSLKGQSKSIKKRIPKEKARKFAKEKRRKNK